MYHFRVVANQLVSPSVLSLSLESADGRLFQYMAGQYAALQFKSHGRPSPSRCFSIISSPTEPGVLRFGIRLTGDYSNRLAQLKAGESVYVQGPFGEFVLDEAEDRSVLMLAAGIGVTPMLSMLTYMTLAKLPITATLIYASRSYQDAPFVDQLQALEAQNPNLRIVYLANQVSLPQSVNAFRQGKIEPTGIANLMRQLPADTSCFVCGPQSFMQSSLQALRENGVAEDRLFSEAFGQRGGVAGALSQLPRTIYGMSAASVLAVVGIFVGASLFHSAKSAAVAPTTTPTSTTQTSNTTTDTNTTSTTATSTPQTVDTTPTTTQMYQQPMSQVS